MNPHPFLGVVFHWLGGLASGSFYVPYKGVRKWSWETYWLVGGIFSWIICPGLLASLLTNDLAGVLRQQSAGTLWWTYFFGAMWGFGGLTFGLTMRYLGMSLGMGVALGYCASFGTLLPPLFKSFVPSIPVAETLGQIAASRPGQITLAGVAVCLLGIGIAALAGLVKEREMPADQKRQAIAEFSFRKGLLVATFSGIMSACFAFALTAGNPIGEASLAAGTNKIWTGLPKLVVVLLGGFTTNFVWCVLLNFRNGSGYQYFAARARPEHAHLTAAAGDAAGSDPAAAGDSRIPVLGNYLFSALAGTTWYFQFFFYTMGETQMGKFSFASWTLHMASIIIFATMWGWIFHEWRGSSRRAHTLIALGIAALVLSTVVIGYGTYLKAGP
jgi:L-rhamnose-H+ transport protein